MTGQTASFGLLPDGNRASLYTLRGPSGEEAAVTDLGATLVRVRMPDRRGRCAGVALGYDSAAEYLENPGCAGATVGRFANRIAGGTFPLEGRLVRLPRNRGAHTIHGGPEGFARRLWQLRSLTEDTAVLELVSPDGDQGFPGTLTVRAAFSLPAPGILSIVYTACSDLTTVCSLTCHAYWNLDGHGSGTPARQTLRVPADAVLETDEARIPTGRLLPVRGTPLDLNAPRSVGALLEGIGAAPELTATRGLDHTYLPRGAGFRPAGEAYDPDSGRRMRVYTDQPAVQVFTGGSLPSGLRGAEGAVYGPWAGYCFETEQYPDAPNHPNFSSALLTAGQTRTWRTEYRFTAE